jgi:hypothetical protein
MENKERDEKRASSSSPPASPEKKSFLSYVTNPLSLFSAAEKETKNSSSPPRIAQHTGVKHSFPSSDSSWLTKRGNTRSKSQPADDDNMHIDENVDTNDSGNNRHVLGDRHCTSQTTDGRVGRYLPSFLNGATRGYQTTSSHPPVAFKVKDTRKSLGETTTSFTSNNKRQKLELNPPQDSPQAGSTYHKPAVLDDDGDDEPLFMRYPAVPFPHGNFSTQPKSKGGEKSANKGKSRGDEIDKKIDRWKAEHEREKEKEREKSKRGEKHDRNVIDLAEDDEELQRILSDPSLYTPPKRYSAGSPDGQSQEEMDAALARQLQAEEDHAQARAMVNEEGLFTGSYQISPPRYGSRGRDILSLERQEEEIRATMRLLNEERIRSYDARAAQEAGRGYRLGRYHSYDPDIPPFNIGAVLRSVRRGRASTDPNLMLSLGMTDRDFNENDYEMLLRLDDSVKNKGAKREEITALPRHKIKKGEAVVNCCICMSDMEVGTAVRTLPCLHYFHVECIDSWLKVNKVCPIDKQQL